MMECFSIRGVWVIALLVMTSFCMAEVYKWQDDEGKWHFSDAPPKGVTLESIKLAESNVVPSVDVKQPEPQKNQIARRGKVVMYSTSWCGYCSKARVYFKRNNIPFTERDIEKSPSAKKRFYGEYGGGGVPLLVYSGKKMRGFSESRFVAFYRSPI